MTHANTFMIGDSLFGMQTLDELGITYEPDAAYRPFSVVDQLGDGSSEGNGSPVVTWHFTLMAPGDADILYNFLDGNISAFVYIRTRLNRLNVTNDDYQWASFGGFMKWMEGDEENPAYHTGDVTITFTGLVAHPEYPAS